MRPASALLALLLLAAPAAALAAPPAPPAALSAEDRALVDKASAYLEGLGQLTAEFTQTNGRGTTSRGRLWLNRPGKARFEYAAPASMIVVSDGAFVLVQDNRLKTFNRYPLGSTPLALFLKRHVRLDQKVTVTRVERQPGGFSITARDGKHEAQGQITLVFDDAPLALTSWTIVDAQGGHTTVRLGPLKPASGLEASLFVLKNPARVPAG